MKSIHAVFVFVFSSLFLISGCAGSGSTAKVTFDMSGSQVASYMGGAVKAPAAGVIPDEVSLIQITVYDNDPSAAGANAIAEAYYTKKQAEEGISLDVPAGEHRYFKATAQTTGASTPVGYASNTAGPVDLQADGETTVSLTMSRSNVNKDAEAWLWIPSFPPAGVGEPVIHSYLVEVCIPIVTVDPTTGKTTFDLNEANPVFSSTSLSAQLKVYPATFQVLIIKAFAADGAVSFLGGGIISKLASGSGNAAVEVTMHTPSKIKPILPSYVSGPVTFTEIVAGTEVELKAFSTWTNDGSTVIDAYSGVSNFNKDNPVDRTINVYFGATLMYRAEYLASNNVLSWKTSQPSFIGQ